LKIIDETPLIKYYIIYDGKTPKNLDPRLEGKVFEWAQWL
jgi:hypothetical protein